MDSSLKNPNFTNRKPPIPPPPSSISPQFHYGNLNFHHPNHHIFPTLPFYSQPQMQTPAIQSPWILQPYGWVDSRIVNGDYRLDYGNQIRDCSNGDLSSNFRSRDGFGDVELQKSYGDCGVLKSESDRYCSSLGAGTSFGYGNVLHGEKRWDETGKDDYYRSEIEPYLDDGKKKSSNETSRRSRDFIDCLDRYASRDFSQSQACENAGNSSVETAGRKESIETSSLSSAAEFDHSLGNGAGKYTSVISVSSSPKSVAGKGISDVQPVEELGLSSHYAAESPAVDQSCKLDFRGLKACLSESNVSLTKDINVGTSEFHFSREVKEKALSSSVSVNEQIQNPASAVEANCSSQCGIIEKERDIAEDMDVDSQKEEVTPTGTSGTDSVPVNGTKNSKEYNKEAILIDASHEKIITSNEKIQPGSSLGHYPCSGQTSPGTDESCELHMDKCGDGVLVEKPDVESIEKLTGVPSDLGSQEVSLNIANAEVYVGEAPSSGEKISGTESADNSVVLLSKLQSHVDGNCAVSTVKDNVVALSLPSCQSKTTLGEKAQKRAILHSAQESYPRSLDDTKKNASPLVIVLKHHTWRGKSDTSASPIVPAKPKATVQVSSTYARKGNSLLRKPSLGSLGESALLNGLPGFVQNGFKSFEAPIQKGYASDCRQKQTPLKLESSNPSKMLYVKRKANQLVAASDIHGANNLAIPSSGAYFKRSRNQLVRNLKSLPNQENPLSDGALDLQKAAKMNSKRSSSQALSDFAVMRPFNQSKFSHVWRQKEPLSRKANRVHISPQKILSRKSPMMKKRRLVYRRSANGYSLKKSKVLSIGGSHLKWFNSNARDSEKPELLLDVESPRSCPPELVEVTKKSSIPNRLVTGNNESVWIRNGNQLVRDPKKRTRVFANEKVRWSLHNVRLRSAKKKKYCQFFTRFGKCNKDDGKCPYIHDPSKIAVCTKFLRGLCASPDCRLTHKVVPESMPDCYYYLQGLCNNEVCPYRHVHVNQKAAICEGFLRGYCADGKECRKKHTYTCPVFEATGHCPQESECKLHHPKNRSKEKKRKRASEPWQKISRGRYFGSMHKDLPESERVLVNDSAVFGGVSPDFIRLDVNEHEASEYTDSSIAESAYNDGEETQNLIYELIRPVGLMQE